MNTNPVDVFFYGLFMDTTLLASRGVSPSETTVGYVDGFNLHIGERATLLPEAGGRAYGVLMKISPDDVAALYSEPSVADYVAETLVVELPGNRQVRAACYNLPAAKLTGTNPAYAAALLALASRLDFPEHYLARIRDVAGSG
jgi:Gamma-glutamyl cyclotransferase, AIG2-like